jgi:two-component system KDP operon response regulator KdpE
MSLPRVLVVDDEPQLRRALRAALVTQGYEVQDAPTGEAALECVRKVRFDLVLLDLNMPGIGGLETCRQLRANSSVAVIMLTVSDGEKSKVAALDAGADDYVTKPFGLPELLARIRAVLRRLPGTPEQQEVVRLGNLEIHFATRRLLANGRPVRITPKEWDLLQFMAAHAGLPIPHARLLQAVWGPDYGGEVQYLRVFVNQLRRKIEPDPAHPRYLTTEPWVGYRLAGGEQ